VAGKTLKPHISQENERY